MQKSRETNRHKDVIIVEHAGKIYETLTVLDNNFFITFILFLTQRSIARVCFCLVFPSKGSEVSRKNSFALVID